MLDISTPVISKSLPPPGNEQNRCSGKPQRKFRSFQLRVFRFEYSVKWKTRSRKTSEFDKCASDKTPRFSTPSFRFWVQREMENQESQNSEFDQCASEKTPRFSAPGFGYSAKWKTPSGKTHSLSFLSRLAKPKCLKCLTHASRKSEKEKREKFLVIGATRCATKFKTDIYQHEMKRILTPNSEQS